MRIKLFLALMVLIAGCGPFGTSTPSTQPAQQAPRTSTTPGPRKTPPSSSSTALSLLTKTALIPDTGGTATPTRTSPACFRLIRPPNGENLPNVERVNFEWERQGGAGYYVFTLVLPTGLRQNTRTTATKLTRPVANSSRPGSYEWSVSAYDLEDELICNAGSHSFSRLADVDQTSTESTQPAKTRIVTVVPTSTVIVPPPPPPTPTVTVIIPPPPPPTPEPNPTATEIVPSPPPPTEPAPIETPTP